MTTPLDVAVWMHETVLHDGELDQGSAVCEIQDRFGQQFVYTNDAGGESIAKSVLSEFHRLTAEDVVWERGALLWRLREPGDEPGRLQL